MCLSIISFCQVFNKNKKEKQQIVVDNHSSFAICVKFNIKNTLLTHIYFAIVTVSILFPFLRCNSVIAWIVAMKQFLVYDGVLQKLRRFFVSQFALCPYYCLIFLFLPQLYFSPRNRMWKAWRLSVTQKIKLFKSVYISKT